MQGTSSLNAALMEGSAQRATRLTLGDYTANIMRAGRDSGTRVAAIFLQAGPNEFLVAGNGDAQITFSTDKPGLPIIGIESIDEEFFQNGAWTAGRRMNGDEDSQGQALHLSATDLAKGKIYRVRLYRYK